MAGEEAVERLRVPARARSMSAKVELRSPGRRRAVRLIQRRLSTCRLPPDGEPQRRPHLTLGAGWRETGLLSGSRSASVSDSAGGQGAKITGLRYRSVALIGLLPACHDKSPVAPGSPPQGPTGPTLHRLEIVGPRSVAPGETVQFGAMGHFDDGSIRDMTREAMWRTSPPLALTVDASGRATGHVLGESILRVQAGVIAGVDCDRRWSSGHVQAFRGCWRSGIHSCRACRGEGRLWRAAERTRRRWPVRLLRGRRLPGGASTKGFGYRDHFERILVTDHVVLNVEMAPVRPRVDVSGLFTLTIAAHESCRNALPEDLRVRRYVAQITQRGPGIFVALEGADFGRHLFIGIDERRQLSRLIRSSATTTTTAATVRLSQASWSG